MPSLQLPHPNIRQDSIFIPEVITTPDHLPTKMDIDTKEEFFPKRLPSVKGELTIQEKSSVRPESWKVSALDMWAKTNLRPCFQKQLADSTGKHSPDKTMKGKTVFRHVLPYPKQFMVYWNHGNHSSCELYPKQFKGTIIKDDIRSNIELNEFPPHPVLKLRGDSMSANKWMREISTGSIIAQNLLRMFANYLLYSLLKGDTDWIPGDENGEADEVSRVQELFSPKKSEIHNVPYTTLLKQVCLKHKEKRSWRVFQPSAQILSDLNSVLSSKYLTEVPKKRENLGQFFPVESTFYGTAQNAESFNTFFL